MKKVMLMLSIHLLATGLSLSQTAFTATYNLSGGGNDVTFFPYNGTNYSGIIMGDLLKVGISSSSNFGNFRGDHWPIGATDGSDIFTGSVDLGKYISFSMSSASGYSFTVNSITFGIGRSSTGPRQWEWRGNQDNYSLILSNYTFFNVNLTNSSGVLTNPDGNGFWLGNILNVNSSYTDVIGMSEFRFYGFNSEGSTGTGGLQGNLTINGTFNFFLPVELTSFTGFANNDKIMLSWATATEVNNYEFEVERTLPRPYPYKGEGVPTIRDGRGWEKIGFVYGNGNSNSPKNYSFIDDDISAGSYLYRLKQIDNDGKFEYSKTVEVSFMKPDAFTLEQNYPNPFNPSTKIKYTIPSTPLSFGERLGVRLLVYDILGNVVATLVNKQQQPGNYEVEFNADKLSSGIYFYRLQAGNIVESKKMILLR